MRRISTSCAVGIVLAAAIAGSGVSLAQNTPDPNSAPNPYRDDVGWAKLEQGRKWGAAVGVDIDRDGKSIWVFDRCASATDCSDSPLNPIQKFDASGKLVTSFGAGLFNYPHALYVDRDNNIWVSDGRAKDNNGKGHTVMKFSPQGRLLMTLGKPGVAGNGPDTFNGPSDVLVAPDGSIFVADGHGGETNARVVKFTKDGKFIKSWGKKGSGPGDFDTPHALAMDSAGPPLRRRPHQQPHPDLRPGGQVPRRVAPVRPAERSLYRQERHPLCRRLELEPDDQSGLQLGHPHRQREGRQGHRLHPVARDQHARRRRGRRRRQRLWRLHQHAQLPPVREASREHRLRCVMHLTSQPPFSAGLLLARPRRLNR